MTLNLIQIFKITTYCTKRTQNMKLHFQQPNFLQSPSFSKSRYSFESAFSAYCYRPPMAGDKNLSLSLSLSLLFYLHLRFRRPRTCFSDVIPFGGMLQRRTGTIYDQQSPKYPQKYFVRKLLTLLGQLWICLNKCSKRSLYYIHIYREIHRIRISYSNYQFIIQNTPTTPKYFRTNQIVSNILETFVKTKTKQQYL